MRLDPRLRAAVTWLSYVAVAVLAWRSLRAPPDPRGPELLALHQRLLGDAPRPIGSASLDAARDRVAAALADAGCAPRRQVGWSCPPRSQTCGFVENLWCRMGPPDGEAVVGLAHLDTVPASPGAADGGAGVVAWVDAVSRLDPAELRRPLIVALTDGEEAGLLGAELLFGDPPFEDEIGAVVNLEARGTTGASLLFEVVGPPRALGPPRGARPNGSSAYAAVYDLLPNDTDLSVVRRGGWVGVNHAFIGGLDRYHTARDDRAHLDPSSLAHHANVALAWVRALQRPPAAGPAVFTDVLGSFVLQLRTEVLWLGWGVGLAVYAYRLRRDWTRLGRPWALAAAIGGVALAAGGAEILAAAVEGAAGPVGWSRPTPLRWAVDLWTAACVLMAARVGGAADRWHAAMAVYAAAGTAAMAADPRLAIVFVPAFLVAALAPAATAPVFGAALLPYAFGLQDALTLSHPGPVAAATALAALGLLPVARADARWAVGAGAAALIAGLYAASEPAFTAERPQPVARIWRQDGQRATLFAAAFVGAPPWPPEGRPPADVPAPRVERVPGGVRVTPARRGALWIEARGPLRVDGVRATAHGDLLLHGVGEQGVVIEGLPTDAAIWERSAGLPEPVPAAATVAAHIGDQTWVRAAQ